MLTLNEAIHERPPNILATHPTQTNTQLMQWSQKKIRSATSPYTEWNNIVGNKNWVCVINQCLEGRRWWAVVINSASSGWLHVKRCFKHLNSPVIFLQIKIHQDTFSYISPSSSRCRAISMFQCLTFYFKLGFQMLING